MSTYRQKQDGRLKDASITWIRNMAWDKQTRAAFLQEELDKKGIAGWGRASHIKNKIGCSNASAAAWLEGSLPKNLDMAIKFCDVFDIDLYQWVGGESRGLNVTEKQLTTLLLRCKAFEDEYGIDLSAKQLAALVLMGFTEPNDMDVFMSNLHKFFNKGDR